MRKKYVLLLNKMMATFREESELYETSCEFWIIQKFEKKIIKKENSQMRIQLKLLRESMKHVCHFGLFYYNTNVCFTYPKIIIK